MKQSKQTRPRAGAEVQSTAHHGASLLARDVRAWRPPLRSADAEILPELNTMVGRSRDMDRNNGVAKGGIQTVVDNVVGTGWNLSPKPAYIALGQTKEWAAEWSRQVKALWALYWQTTACHAGDTLNGDLILQQSLRALLMAGDACALPLWINDRGDNFSTKLQPIESDRLSNPYGAVNTIHLRGGIEFDDVGMPIAYNFRRAHPGDWYIGGGINSLAFQWERIPRRTDFGRLRVLHAFDADRSGQSRGKPVLSSVLPEFKQLDRYKRAELEAAVANAMVSGTITTPLTHDDIVEMFKSDPKGYQTARAESAVRLEPGTLVPLFPGDKLEPFLPTRPSSSFGPFCENILRFIGVSLDLPYELILKDFSKTNYSSARAAMLEAWRAFNRRRDSLGTQFGDPIYALWLEEVVNDGRIEAPDFYANKAAYTRCRWIGPGRGWVDPVKEAQATALRLDANLSTLEQECAEQGLDWLEVLEQRAVEIVELKRLGLPIVAQSVKPAVSADNAASGDNPVEDASNTASNPTNNGN